MPVTIIEQRVGGGEEVQEAIRLAKYLLAASIREEYVNFFSVAIQGGQRQNVSL